ncbi:MAG: hypothetical protein R3E66_24890 [bacterium]
MTWFAWLHHVSIHAPLALSFALAVLGVWVNRRDDETVWTILRFGGWFVVFGTVLAVVSGLVTADEFWTDDGPYVLIHHRNLGLTGLFSVVTAAVAVEWGYRTHQQRVRRFGALVWIAAALAMMGAGHWGGSGVHSDRVPWDGEPPVLRTGER